MKKKILHILVLPKLAGSQKMALEVLKGISNDEFEKFVLFGKGNNDSIEDVEVCFNKFREANVTVLQCQYLRRNIGFLDILAIIYIYKICRKYKFDIVNTNSTKPGFIGRIAAWLAGVPFVIHTVHGLAFHKFVKFPLWQFYFICEQLASLFCHKIILVNKYYSKYFKLFKKKTKTIYNCLDFSSYPTINSDRQKYSEKIKLLFIGRLDIPKDPFTLLKTMDFIVNKKGRRNFNLTMVGDGEFYSVCAQYVNEHNLSDFVFLDGWKSDVIPYYLDHDIFCLSSIYEAFGLIFLEAGYYGLPTIATNVEGIPEVVVDGVTGFLVPCRNPNEFANKIIELAENKERREKMGKAAKERVEKYFKIENMIEEYRNIYLNG